MQLILNAAQQKANIEKLAVSVNNAQDAKAAEEARANKEMVGEFDAKMKNQPEADTFGGKDFVKSALKQATGAYLIGFCFGFCPPLFLLAAGAFLFSNKGEAFRDKLAQAIENNVDAMAKFAEQQAPVQNNAQAAKAEAPENKTATNPIQEAKAPAQVEKAPEQKALTPQQRAQQRYDKAQENQAKAEMNLQRKEEAQRVADEKVELAQAKLDQAQAEYDKANAQMKMQMTDKMMRLQESLATKQSNATVAKEKADVARAILQEAGVKLANAQRALEDVMAEEIVTD